MTLSESLRAMADDNLVALLRQRPDLAVPPPADLRVLANRAAVQHSVQRALEQLDAFTLTVLDGLLVLGGDGVSSEELSRFVGHDVADAVSRLRSLALVWGGESELHVVGTLRQLIAYPAGLGSSAAELGLPAPELTALPPDLDDAERDVLERLAAGPPIGVAPSRGGSAVERLVIRGLLARHDDNHVELPREVGLLLRGNRPLGEVPVDAPPLEAAVLDPGAVDAVGAGQVLEALRLVTALLDEFAAEPARELRSGGIGVRDLRRLAKGVEIDEPRAAVLIEIAAAARLLDVSGDLEQREWLPTRAYDDWLGRPPARRWATIAQAWLEMPRQAALIGQRDDRDRVITPLSYEVSRPGAPDIRRRVLESLADLPPGTAPRRAALLGWLAWHAPYRGGRMRDLVHGWVLDEAEQLGFTGRGAITSYAAELVRGRDPAASLADRLPAPLDHILLQADLTAVAPGPLEPALARELALVADVESSGGATVYRITTPSVRRALDAGRTAADLHELFRSRSRTPVPQGLTYLIDDVARRHGGVRIGAAQSYLRCDDESTVSELTNDRKLGSLRLRRLAPTVMVSPVRPQQLLEGLRGAGYAPVQESVDGSVVVSAAEPRRAAQRRFGLPGAVSVAPAPPQPSDEQLQDVVRTMRVGDRVSRVAPRRSAEDLGVPGITTARTLGLLQEAVRDRLPVVVSFVDNAGNVTSRMLQPLSVSGGFLRAEDERTETLHTVALHRITSAELVQ